MAAELLNPVARATDSNGRPYSGAVWRFYETLSLTPQAVYADANLSVSLGDTVVADSGGKFPAIYFDASKSYRAVLTNASGSVTLHDIDPVNDRAIADLEDDGGATLLGYKANLPNTVKRQVAQVLYEHISVADFGVVADDMTLNTVNMQRMIDAVHTKWLGGTQLGGGIEVRLPPGRIKTGSLIYRNGVNLIGAGKMHSQLLVSGDNQTLFAVAPTAAVTTAAQNVFYGHWRDFYMGSAEGQAGSIPVGQTLWRAIGFSRWNCMNMYFGWGPGLIAIDTIDATPAGEGGPTSWYNDLFGCEFEKHYIQGSGGVGVRLGDMEAEDEQLTTWKFFGGFFRGAGNVEGGTALAIQSSTGMSFWGTTFEANDIAIALGTDAGTRQTNNIEFFGCYWEGNNKNWVIKPNNPDSAFIGGFVTGGTYEDAPANRTRYSIPGMTQSYIASPSSDFWRILLANGAVNRPKIMGSVPSLGLENEVGDELVLANLKASSANTSYGQFLEDDVLTNLLAFGRTELRAQATKLIAGNTDASAFALMSGNGAPSGNPGQKRVLYFRLDGSGGSNLYLWNGAAWSAIAGV